MSKTKFNKLHTNNITINGTKYRVLQSKNSRSCSLCDCNYKSSDDCIDNTSDNNYCTGTIGPYGYLKRINHGKN